MGKLLFFSDLHFEGDGSREKGLEDIVQLANEKGVDKLVFGGDIIGHSPALVAGELDKKNPKLSASVYARLSDIFYNNLNHIVSGFKGEVHGIQGNHDPIGIFERVSSMNFKPTNEIGKVYMESAPLKSWYPNWDRITIPENLKFIEHAIKIKPKIMLWHQGPYDVKYSENSEFKCPKELYEVGNSAHINLHGHNHSTFVKYDPKNKKLDVNMITQDGYFAIVEYNDDITPLAIEVYRNMDIVNAKPDLNKIASELYNLVLNEIQQSDSEKDEKKAA